MLNRVRRFIPTIVLVLCFFAGWFTYDWLSFIRRPLIAPDKPPIDYILEPGASIFVLARDLQKLGIVEHPWHIVLLGEWTRLANKLKAGEYRFMPGMKPLQLLQLIASGKVLSHQLTIVEGWTFDQMLAAIRKEPKIKQTLANFPPEAIMAKLGAVNTSPEGLFFPDTYRYTRGTTDFAILRVAYNAMNKHLLAEWEKRAANLPYKTPYEALIVASLVEKETGLKAERALVAGVIVNRLRKNMLLQIDPTIMYGISNSYKHLIRGADLKKDTPYNTYLHPGLPPTPIDLPSLASIQAALHPHEGDYLYFVAKGDGTHQFSSNLREHNNAVKNFIRKKQLNNDTKESLKSSAVKLNFLPSFVAGFS